MTPLASLLLALPLAVATPVTPRTLSSLSTGKAHGTRQSHGVVSLPIRRASGRSSVAQGSRRLQRVTQRLAQRDTGSGSPPQQRLVDHAQYYLADLGIGTPPQPMSLLVDTGGWVTWVNPDCAYAPQPTVCLEMPTYDPAASRPAPERMPALDQVISYGGSMGVSMLGYADVMTWGLGGAGNSSNSTDNMYGTTRVPAQPFGVANATAGLSTSILALAPDGLDGFDSAVSNISVVSTMAQQGLIASRVFSLAYGRGDVAVGAHAGGLVFGGVDKSQFRGALRRTAILPRDASVDGWRYWVAVTEVRHNRPDGTVGVRSATGGGFNGTYLLDSGTPGIYVGRATYDAILAEANLTRNELRPEGFPEVDCAMRSQPGSLSFTFVPSNNNSNSNSNSNSSMTIHVPYADMVHTQTNLLTGDSSRCYFALSSAGPAYDDGDIFPILGAEFFKASYVVFDWDNREVSLAQGANCGEPDLVSVGKGADAVPSIKGNCK